MTIKTESTVTVAPEIPEGLHRVMTKWLEGNSDWDENRVYAAALSLFLLQGGHSGPLENSRDYRATARIYLDSLFPS